MKSKSNTGHGDHSEHGHTTTFRRPGLRRIHDRQARRENLAVDDGEILGFGLGLHATATTEE
jgi:hypothetical protein